jgi:hypothetical protein
VITAFATAHGIVIATSGTAKLESTPIPPPQTTKRTKEARGPGMAGEDKDGEEGEDGDWVLSAVFGSMVFPPARRGLLDPPDPGWIG